MIRRWLVFVGFLTVSGFPLPKEGPEQKSADDSGEKTVCLRVNEIPSKEKEDTNFPQLLIEILGPPGRKGIKYKVLKVDDKVLDQGPEPRTKTAFTAEGGSKEAEDANPKLLVDSGDTNTRETPTLGRGNHNKVIPQVVSIPAVHSPANQTELNTESTPSMTDYDLQVVNRTSISTGQFDEDNEKSEDGDSAIENHEQRVSTVVPLYTEHNATLSWDDDKDTVVEDEFKDIHTMTFSNDTQSLSGGIGTDEPPASKMIKDEDGRLIDVKTEPGEDVETTSYEPSTLQTHSIPPRFWIPGFEEKYNTGKTSAAPLDAGATPKITTVWPSEVITDENGRLIDVLTVMGEDDESTSYKPSTLQMYSSQPSDKSPGERFDGATTETYQNSQYQGMSHTRTPDSSFRIDPDEHVATFSSKIHTPPEEQGVVGSNDLSSGDTEIFTTDGIQDQGHTAVTGGIGDPMDVTANLHVNLPVNDWKIERILVTGAGMENTTEVAEVSSSSDVKFDGQLDQNATEPTTEGYIKILSDLQDTKTTPATELPQSTNLRWENTPMERSTDEAEYTAHATDPPAATFQSEMPGPTTVLTNPQNSEILETKSTLEILHTTPNIKLQKPLPTQRALPDQPDLPELSPTLDTTRSPVAALEENFNNFTMVFPTVSSINREPHNWRYLPDQYYAPRRIYFPDWGTP